MTTGDDGPLPPDAEHYLDLSDVQDEQAGPHFDVVLRGYDRRQVDEHVAGLRRMVGQLKAQLAVRRRRSDTAAGSASVGSTSDVIPEARTPAELSSASEGGAIDAMDTLDAAERRDPDTVGAFNDRLRGILAAAEQEAQMVRSRAAESLLAEHTESRAALADLRAQRDAVFDDLVRLRGWLDELVTSAGRPGSPPPAISAPGAPQGPGRPGPWRPRGPVPGPAYGPRPRPQSRPQPRPHPAPPPDGADRAGGRDQGGTADLDAPTAITDTGSSGTDIRPGLPAGLDAADTTDIASTPDTPDTAGAGETGAAGAVSGERSRG